MGYIKMTYTSTYLHMLYCAHEPFLNAEIEIEKTEEFFKRGSEKTEEIKIAD